MADLDDILSNIDLEEQKMETEEKDWYCGTCEHGPMMDNDTNCSRCGEKHIASRHQEEMTGWEDEDIEAEVEEIF